MEIDILVLLKAIWHRLWAVVLAAVICGAALFIYAKCFIAPTYKAEAMMYVNNSALSVGTAKLSITSGELSAAQKLISTYSVILKTRSTLEEVIREGNLDLSYGQLSSMISSGSVNETEIFRVTVTAKDPALAEKVANTIAKVLPNRISDIVEGSSMRIVDYAVKPTGKSGPSVTRYTMIGIVVGALLACAVIVVIELLDDQIHGGDYLTETYKLPVLAETPLLGQDARVRKRVKGYGYSGYGYGYEKSATAQPAGKDEAK